MIALHSTTVCRGLPTAGVMLALLVLLWGCGGDDEPSSGAGDTIGGAAAAGTDGGESRDGKKQANANQPPPPAAWAAPLVSAVDHLDHARLDEAQKQLDAAEALLADAEDTPEKTTGGKELESLKSQLTSAREAEVKRLAEEKAQKRAGRLVEAKELQESGKLDEATAALDAVLSMAPTIEQRETVRELKDAIETHRAARRRLGDGRSQHP